MALIGWGFQVVIKSDGNNSRAILLGGGVLQGKPFDVCMPCLKCYINEKLAYNNLVDP